MNEPTPRRSLVPGPSTVQRSATDQATALRKTQEQHNEQRLQSRPTPTALMQFPVGGIAKGIAGVMSEVGTINKGGYNSFHRYHYARMEDLLQAITPLMGKHGLAIIQNEVEIKQIENRVAITYEFSIIHSSGEMWPERPRQTGMCMARNSKGDWDDKALNKCHTSARKYFLLALFQVPAGDFEEDQGDPDRGDANQRQERSPVPGPKTISEKAVAQREQVRPQSEEQVARPQSERGADRSVPGPQQKRTEVVEEGPPHKIVLGQGAGADQWAAAFIRVIGRCASQDEIKQWDATNDPALQAMSQHYPEVYETISAAVERRINDLEAPKEAPKPGLGNGSGMMPDPKQDAQEAMNWVAAQLQLLKSWEGAKAFWNQYVMPRERDFDQLDWEMLMEEWKRAELRLAPPDDDVTTTQGLT